MPATYNDQTQLTGLFKQVYAKSVVDAFSFAAPLASKRIKYEEQAATGDYYNQPVDLVLEHSITAAASNTTPTYLALNAGVMQNAQMRGAQLFGRAGVTYEAISRAAQAGPKAFESATKRVVKRLGLSHLKRLEMQLLCGQSGIAVGSAISGAGGTRALVVSEETWSAARFAGMVGATLAMVRNDGTTAVAPSTGAVGSFFLSSVTASTRTLNITADATDATAMDTHWPAGGILFWESNGTKTEFGTTTEMAGLSKWANMSGTFANISTSTYDLWNGNIYSTSTGIISFAKLVEAAEMVGAYGAVDKLCAVVSLKAFSVLNTDIAALRQFDSSYQVEKGTMGVKGITFNTSVGELEILPHPLQCDGKIQIFCPSEALRVGSTDITFIQRGSGGDKLILESSTTPSSEMRTQSNQALFIEQPRHVVELSGITFS